MSAYHIINLDRKAYLASVDEIADAPTRRFADMSLKWWDRHFSWSAQGCAVLCSEKDEHLCYLFYKIDRYRDYITFHNIFTPLAQRRCGYARMLLNMVFMLAIAQHVKRFRITSISRSLDFYLPLGFAYWGVNSVGDYYCDLPVPAEGLEGLDAMVRDEKTSTLIGNAGDAIRKKIGRNETKLDTEQTRIYEGDIDKMGARYLHDDFNDLQP
jgi:GNAT superfamily N-acetyltransferase